jgi:hypothetical protein
MGNVGMLAAAQGMDKFNSGYHELYFKVVVWNADRTCNQPERWGLQVKSGKGGLALGYFEWNTATRTLAERKNAGYHERPDRCQVTGTLRGNLYELRKLAEISMHRFQQNEESVGPLADRPSEQFVMHLLREYGLSRNQRGAVRLGSLRKISPRD